MATLTLAEVWSEDARYPQANALFASIPDSSQYYLKSRLRMAVNQDRQGKTEEALKSLDALAQAMPSNSDPLAAKGDLLRVHKRFLEASLAYSQAIKQANPPSATDWTLYYARGACLERLDKWSEAEIDLKKALELKPNQPDVLNYLAYSWLTRGVHIEEARAMLATAISARPNDPQIIDSYGRALYLEGKYAEAMPYLERAVELLPSDASANDHLGDLYWRLGRKVESRFQWQRALSLSPEEDEMEAINKKLVDGLPDHEAINAAKASEKPSASLITDPAPNIP